MHVTTTVTTTEGRTHTVHGAHEHPLTELLTTWRNAWQWAIDHNDVVWLVGDDGAIAIRPSHVTSIVWSVRTTGGTP